MDMWSPPVITAIGGVVAILIAQVTNSFIAYRSSRKLADIGKSVDGAETRMLAEIAALSNRVADLTKKPGDAIRADAAQTNVDAKAALAVPAITPVAR